MTRDSSPSLPHESAEFSRLVPPTTAACHHWAEYGQLSQTHSGFCIAVSSSGQQIEGVARTTHSSTSQSKGLYGGYFLMPIWIQGGLHVPNLPIRELPLLNCSLSSFLLTSMTNCSLSWGRTDACEAGGQTWLTSYMNILTMIKSLFSRLYTCGWHFTCSSAVIYDSPWCRKYFCLRHLKSPGISLPWFMQRFP